MPGDADGQDSAPGPATATLTVTARAKAHAIRAGSQARDNAPATAADPPPEHRSEPRRPAMEPSSRALRCL